MHNDALIELLRHAETKGHQINTELTVLTKIRSPEVRKSIIYKKKLTQISVTGSGNFSANQQITHNQRHKEHIGKKRATAYHRF